MRGINILNSTRKEDETKQSAIAHWAISNHKSVNIIQTFRNVQFSISHFTSQLHTSVQASEWFIYIFIATHFNFEILRKRKRKRTKTKTSTTSTTTKQNETKKMSGESNSGYGYYNSQLTHQCDDETASRPTTQLQNQWVAIDLFGLLCKLNSQLHSKIKSTMIFY